MDDRSYGISASEATRRMIMQFGGQLVTLQPGRSEFVDAYANPSLYTPCVHPGRRPWWSWLRPARIGYRGCTCGRRWAWDAGRWREYGTAAQRRYSDEPSDSSLGAILSNRLPCPCPAGDADCMGCDE